jgi:hypothetical protein
LSINDHTAAQVDKSRGRIAHAVLLVLDRKAIVTYLMKFHSQNSFVEILYVPSDYSQKLQRIIQMFAKIKRIGILFHII